jgi:LmbE family N-acetylglucosaminyl deacetylase
MQFCQSTAELFVPDGAPLPQALARTTHLGIGAHQDDLEIMAVHGILECYRQKGRWFTGVVVTDGAGSPRSGRYGRYTDSKMVQARQREQRQAAVVGEYAAAIQLAYPSAPLKDPSAMEPVNDLIQILEATAPEVVYTHNLADKHDTHVAVALRLIQALRSLPKAKRPAKVYGMEVWRDLDWMVDNDKVALDVSGNTHLQAALVGVFDSQIAGGKRYDLAALGRRRAHATYHASHGVDQASGLDFAMDLTPLMEKPALDPLLYVEAHVQRLAEDIRARFRRVRGG